MKIVLIDEDGKKSKEYEMIAVNIKEPEEVSPQLYQYTKWIVEIKGKLQEGE